MTPDEAITAIRNLIDAEVAIMKQMYTKRGVTKKAYREEAAAAGVLFNALTDEHFTEDQMKAMVRY